MLAPLVTQPHPLVYDHKILTVAVGGFATHVRHLSTKDSLLLLDFPPHKGLSPIRRVCPTRGFPPGAGSATHVSPRRTTAETRATPPDRGVCAPHKGLLPAVFRLQPCHPAAHHSGFGGHTTAVASSSSYPPRGALHHPMSEYLF